MAGGNGFSGGVEAIAEGFVALRELGLFCDALVAGVGELRLPVHQVVLAAASPSLRQYLCGSAGADAAAKSAGRVCAASFGAALRTAPQPIELRLQGVSSVHELRNTLDRIYGGKISAGANSDATILAKGLQLVDPSKGAVGGSAAILVSGLQELRLKSLLCDLIIVVKGRRLEAHQAVLAAASPAIRQHLWEALAGLSHQKQPAVGTQPLELELEALSQVDAVRLFLDHVYGADTVPGWKYTPSNEAVNADVLRLAVGFELPSLKRRATEWLAEAAGKPLPPRCKGWSLSSRLALCDELKLSELRAIIAGGGVSPDSPKEGNGAGTPQQKGPRELSEQQTEKEHEAHDAKDRNLQEEEGQKEEEEDEDEEEEIKKEQDGHDEPMIERGVAVNSDKHVTAEDRLGQASKFSQKASYWQPRVPQEVLPGLPGPEGRLDFKVLGRLYEVFEERPCYLMVSLRAQLPASVSEETLLRLLPYVAYQWVDGPWKKAFCRLGWDPRHDASAAWKVQVLVFRDPHFRQNGAAKQMPRGCESASDCHFLKPPRFSTQYYQIEDIKDQFVKDLIACAETEAECDKRNGWVSEYILEGVLARLTFKSQQMRDKLIAGKKALSRAKPSAVRCSVAKKRRLSS